MKVFYFSWLIIVLCSTVCFGKIDSDTKDRITSSLDAVITVANKIKDRKDALKAAGKAVGPLVSSIGKLAPMLGAVGAFLPVIFAFLPQEDSAELKYMKEKFAGANNKLDKITEKLDNIATLITYENQRAEYINMEGDVRFGYDKLKTLFDEITKVKCTSKNQCEKLRLQVANRYLDYFKKVEFSLDKILKGLTEKTVFKEPLLELTRDKFKCNIGKLTELTESIFELAQRGQQVILTYHKLAGSNTSVIKSVNRWLNSIYTARDYYYKVKNQCYKNIGNYISKDVADLKYQKDFSSDDDANNALGLFLDKKYDWVKWNVHSYNEFKSDLQTHKVIEGFSNVPGQKENQKRIIIATPYDPNGEYSVSDHNAVIQAIKTSVNQRKKCVIEDGDCLSMIEERIKAKELWGFIQSVTVLDTEVTQSIRKTYDYSIIDEKIQLKNRYLRIFKKKKVRVIIMLRSKESADSQTLCTKKCYKKAKCVKLPFSKISECQCPKNFDGDICENHSKISLSATMDLMVTETLKVPNLVDTYYSVQDLRDEINAGSTRIVAAISKLTQTLIKSYKKIEAKIEFNSLRDNYGETIEDIQNTAEALKERSGKDNDKSRKKLAASALDKVKPWISKLKKLFYGDDFIFEHEPLMILMINSHKNLVCTDDYKKKIDDVFRKFSVIQQEAYFIWIESLDIQEQDTSKAAKEFVEVLKKQVSFLEERICYYDIPNSENVCGMYIHPQMSIPNKCKENYYLKGAYNTTCHQQGQSKCLPCDCDRTGSIGGKCDDQSGQCDCRKFTYHSSHNQSYYGVRCQDRDCQWSSWSNYSSCSSCYEGSQIRNRSIEITTYGSGSSCSGSFLEKQSCFIADQYHCRNKNKCIDAGSKCNYDNDCGDWEDESDSNCPEYCEDSSSSYTTYGNGKVINLYGPRVTCKKLWVMQRFQYQKLGSHIRFLKRCCKMRRYNFIMTEKQNKWTKAWKNYHLNEQFVGCPKYYFMNGYSAEGMSKTYVWEWRSWNHIRYSYKCNKIDIPNLRNRIACKKRYTAWASMGNGDTKYLANHDVDCKVVGRQWFLRYFQLESNKNTRKIRYRFYCCRIKNWN